MKKTLNINLAGYPFIIDEDAYLLLKEYLDTIKSAFNSSEDIEDLPADIEIRIAEILTAEYNGKDKIISIEEISQIIERIGQPSDFIEIDETIERSESTSQISEEIETEVHNDNMTPPPYEANKFSKNQPERKRLFRDPQNSMLGGVCSGLAYYLHLDPTIVRLITVLLFFLSASTVVIVYIILWIVVPQARTPYQRMQMMGTDPTMENIGKTVTENFQDVEKEDYTAKSSKSNSNGFLSSSLSIFAKCLIILCLIFGIPILLVFILIIICCIIAFFVCGTSLIGNNIFGTSLNFQAPEGGMLAYYLLLAAIGGIITIGVPIWLLCRMIFKKNESNLSPSGRRSMLIIWLAGIALAAVFTVKTVRKSHEINDKMIHGLNPVTDSIEDMTIDESGIMIESKTGKTVTIDESGIKVTRDKEKIYDNETGVADTLMNKNKREEMTIIEKDSVKN